MNTARKTPIGGSSDFTRQVDGRRAEHADPQRSAGDELRPYGISSRTLRIGDATPKGYEAGDFADAWRRYLPAVQ